jgi:DNA processing protein
MALGVDGAAHAGALRAGGDTIAVLGTGPDVAYPRAHRKLHDAIGERGLLVSEFLPGTVAAPHNFPRRNRILAALSATTVVVEAGARSGSLITVDHALDLGRDVWAVPGPIERTFCRGSNRLLGDGARPLVDIDDFVAEVTGRARAGRGSVGRATARAATAGVADRAATSLEADDALRSATRTPEDRVLAVLAEEALNADAVAERCALPVQTVLAVLTTLELHGEVERMPGLRFRRAA